MFYKYSIVGAFSLYCIVMVEPPLKRKRVENYPILETACFVAKQITTTNELSTAIDHYWNVLRSNIGKSLQDKLTLSTDPIWKLICLIDNDCLQNYTERMPVFQTQHPQLHQYKDYIKLTILDTVLKQID